MKVSLHFNCSTHLISLPTNASVDCLQTEVSKILEIPPEQQKIIFMGRPLTQKDRELSTFEVRNGAKLLLLTSLTQSLVKNYFSEVNKNWVRKIRKFENMQEEPHYSIVNKGAPKGSLISFPNLQHDVLPSNPFVVYDQDGNLGRLFFESNALFLISENKKATRIFFNEIRKYNISPINADKYVCLMIESDFDKIVVYYIPFQYTFLIEDIINHFS